jgi:hypothetical protein
VNSGQEEMSADLITEINNIEDKMGKCISTIKEELKTEISDLRAGQEDLCSEVQWR